MSETKALYQPTYPVPGGDVAYEDDHWIVTSTRGYVRGHRTWYVEGKRGGAFSTIFEKVAGQQAAMAFILKQMTEYAAYLNQIADHLGKERDTYRTGYYGLKTRLLDEEMAVRAANDLLPAN